MSRKPKLARRLVASILLLLILRVTAGSSLASAGDDATVQVDQTNLPAWAGGWTNINPTTDGRASMWQTFTPSWPNLIAVDVDIYAAAAGSGGDTLTVEIAGDGEILASRDLYVEDGFDGLLRFEFDDVVPVVPERLYELRVRGTGATRFGWRYGSNTYDRGSRYVFSNERPNTDWFFQTYSSAGPSEPRIIYVDDDAAGANGGTNWENAYAFLQDALADADSAEKPVEIHVAQGIYKPDEGTGITRGDREATFQLINGVTLKGSYAGTPEANPNTRDIELYKTILSGDLNGDDVEVVHLQNLLIEPNRTDNSYHVITGSNIDETAILDGFIIISGNASVFPNNDGGGIVKLAQQAQD